MGNVIQHSKETVEWYTPQDIIESSRVLMGGIDLDPASNHVANRLVQAAYFFSESNDGLQKCWGGNVFLNPPGGDAPRKSTTRSNAVLWWSKLAHEYRCGNIQQAVFIGFSVEILQQAQALQCDQPTDFPFCIPRDRTKFIDHRTMLPAKMPGHANVIVYLPPKDGVEHAKHVFRREFFKYGRILNV